jgi:hypothetical protein
MQRVKSMRFGGIPAAVPDEEKKNTPAAGAARFQIAVEAKNSMRQPGVADAGSL